MIKQRAKKNTFPVAFWVHMSRENCICQGQRKGFCSTPDMMFGQEF